MRTHTTPTQAKREQIARAMMEAFQRKLLELEPDACEPVEWYDDDEGSDVSREYFRAAADAVFALSALERAPDVDGLARTIAQADFIWGLGEQGVMACAPDIAGKMFDEAWADATSATRQKFLHIAQVVRAAITQDR